MTCRSIIVGKCLIVLILTILCNIALAQNDKESIYTTCDLDLENIESLLPYLPSICTEIYRNRTEDATLYQTYLDEAKEFGKFSEKLNKHELGPDYNAEKELETYPFDKDLREKIYAKVDLAECITTTANMTALDYLNCVKNKRIELLKLVPPGVE